jgi:hypothetical protein
MCNVTIIEREAKAALVGAAHRWVSPEGRRDYLTGESKRADDVNGEAEGFGGFLQRETLGNRSAHAQDGEREPDVVIILFDNFRFRSR